MDGFTLSIYDGIELVSPEVSIEGTKVENLEGLLICDWIGSIYVFELGTDVGNELVLSDGKMLGTTLGDIYGL